MKRIALTVTLTMLLILALTAGGAAAFKGNPPGSWPQTSSRAEKRQEVQDERARRIQERISLVINRFNNNKERHVAAYNSARAKVVEIITAFEAKGYDVSKLSQDLQTWDTMIVKMATDYTDFINKLTAAQKLVPFESQGQFGAALQTARQQLIVVRGDMLEIRSFYQATIRPDIQALKLQKAAATAPASTP